jgi:hypothetical protein
VDLTEGAAPPRLSTDELRAEQARTLATPRRRYGPAARALFILMDVLYGRRARCPSSRCSR